MVGGKWSVAWSVVGGFTQRHKNVTTRNRFSALKVDNNNYPDYEEENREPINQKINNNVVRQRRRAQFVEKNYPENQDVYTKVDRRMKDNRVNNEVDKKRKIFFSDSITKRIRMHHFNNSLVCGKAHKNHFLEQQRMN